MNRHFVAFNLHQVRTPSLHEKTVDEKSLLRREMFLTFLQKKQHMCCNPIVKVNSIKKLIEASRDKSLVCAKLAEIFAPCFVEQYHARFAPRSRVFGIKGSMTNALDQSICTHYSSLSNWLDIFIRPGIFQGHKLTNVFKTRIVDSD